MSNVGKIGNGQVFLLKERRRLVEVVVALLLISLYLPSVKLHKLTIQSVILLFQNSNSNSVPSSHCHCHTQTLFLFLYQVQASESSNLFYHEIIKYPHHHHRRGVLAKINVRLLWDECDSHTHTHTKLGSDVHIFHSSSCCPLSFSCTHHLAGNISYFKLF
jgi:hypothetical protein